MRAITLLFAALFIGAGYLMSRAGGPPAPAGATLPPPLITTSTRLLVFGDSLAVGLGPHVRAIVVARGGLAGTRARVGMHMSEGAASLGNVLDEEKPTVVMVSLGTNDCASAQQGAGQAKFALELARAAHERGVELVWIGLPTLPAKLAGAEDVREILRAVPGTTYLDSTKMNFARSADGVHATPSGYADWAAQLLG